jgi:hypothetical protein
MGKQALNLRRISQTEILSWSLKRNNKPNWLLILRRISKAEILP